MSRRPRLAAAASVVALAITGVGLSANPAHAVVTATSITAVSYPSTFTLVQGSKTAAAQNAAALELDGSYNRSGATSDGIDSLCYSGTGTTVIGTQGSPANGTFQVIGPAPVGQICDLRAVPSGTVPTGYQLASYPAQRRAFDYAGTTVSGTGVPVHVEAALPQTSARVTLGDAVSNGPTPTGGATTNLLDGALTPTASSVFTATGVLPSDGATTSKVQTQQGGIRVDGVNVLTPGVAADIWGADGNQPDFHGSVAVTSSLNAQTGDATVTSSEPLLKCPDTSLPATKTTCTSFTPVGVTLRRTTTTAQGGRVIRITDSFSSAAAHSLALDYEHTVTSTSTGTGDAGVELSTDGGGSYVSGTQGTPVRLPAAPFSVLIKSSGDGTSFAHPAGSMTYSAQPTSAEFANGGSTLVTHYDRFLAAAGTFTLSHSYVSSDTDATVKSLSAYALNTGLAPGISIATPPSVSTQNVSIAGLVTPGQNGLPLTVTGPGGTSNVDQVTGAFAMPTVLHTGQQALTFNATDPVGQVSSLTASVSYDNPLTLGRLDGFIVYSSHVVVSKKKVGRRIVVTKARVRYVSGVRLQVPLHCSSQATSVCTARIKVNSHGKTLKTVVFTRGPGYRPIVTIPIVASYYRNAGYNAAHLPKPTKAHPRPKPGLWSVSVTVSYTDPSGVSYPGSFMRSLRI